VWRPDGEPHHQVAQREHFDGQLDGRVGGTYVDQETEERWRKGLIVVQGITPMTLADLEKAMIVAKKKYHAHRKDPAARQAFQEMKRMLVTARAAARQQDPRRQFAGAGV
jgi:hypothetical protein